MTIEIAVRTSSAVVFAADSKLTTSGLVGFEQDGKPRFVQQSYDNAVKLVSDQNRVLMAMVAGQVTLGTLDALEFISKFGLPYETAEQRNQRLFEIVRTLHNARHEFWGSLDDFPAKDWPGTTLMVATTSTALAQPQVWKIDWSGPWCEMRQILQSPGIYLEGSYAQAFSLLYGYDADFVFEAFQKAGIESEKIEAGLYHSGLLRPIDRLSLDTMPIQDAMDLAVFLANVQIEMGKFLPGMPLCGGPIDLMVLQMAPSPTIRSYPGKSLHHPSSIK